MRKILLLLGLMVIVGCLLSPINYEKFAGRDIKNDFCGPVMEAKFCKCAFHGDLCDDAEMTSSKANEYIQAEFKKWEQEQKQAWIAACKADPDKKYNDYSDQCEWCAPGFYYNVHGECIESE